ncbi:MAG: hypothetical protein KatS3mg008_0023 [Acidimicrobiales bacterium]|nr:MAG: hypothetical protein KatS3mg008_0023 [Acidimicrobiales bacterium]
MNDRGSTTDRPPRPAETTGSGVGLLPVVCLVAEGRSGSTMTMELLGSCDEVAFERAHRYETRHLTYAARIARLYEPELRAPTSSDRPTRRIWAGVRSRLDRLFGLPPGTAPWGTVRTGPQFFDTSLPPQPRAHAREPELGSITGPDGTRLRTRVLAALWRVVGEQISHEWTTRTGTPPRWYAEKTPWWVVTDVRDVVPTRILYLVRDPRDVWCSRIAFDPAGRGFRRAPRTSRARHLHETLQKMRKNLERIPERPSEAELVVRYEDLVLRRADEARRLSLWLGVELDPTAPPPDPARAARHMTSTSASSSIGRWRRELDREVARAFETVLGEQLDRFGYERS